jgi:hypothetical protein
LSQSLRRYIEAGDLIGIGLADSIARQPLFARLQEVLLASAIVEIGIDASP